jgi:DNA repair photolyase
MGEYTANVSGLAMETAPLLFDLGRSPTSRQVADLVKTGGAEALTEATRRADQARYQEIHCRSALNRVKGMPFNWTLNPYRGCTHGCHYCYARRYHSQFELDAGDEFASVILVKTNLIGVLRRELQKPSWTNEEVAVGTATDCYQPIEGVYKLTRGVLQTLCAFATPTGLVTKGPMVVRDKDVLVDLSARTDCSVCISVPCVDDEVWQQLEPGTAHPLQRLRAVRELVDSGIHAGVLMNPIVPGISSKPALLERTMKAVADHGARFVGCNVMYLQDGSRDHFMKWLADEHPHMVDGYERLYAAKYPPREYQEEVKRMIGLLKKKYDVGGDRPPKPRSPDPSQQSTAVQPSPRLSDRPSPPRGTYSLPSSAD